MCARRVLASLLGAVTLMTPALAFERLPQPTAGAPLVTSVADLDTSPRVRGDRYRGSDVRWQWRYRAAYTRWLHNEYSRAGYPVQHRQFRTYVHVVPCCCCGDRWHW